MATKFLMVTAALSLATLSGCVTAASAHDVDNMGHSLHSGHHHSGVRMIVDGYNDCGYLFNKWQFTDNWYWKQRFLACKYGG